MGKINVRLRDSYPNEVVTTIAGAVVKKGDWVAVDEDDYEIRHFLETNTVIELEGRDTMEEKIVLKDTPTEGAIKEVVGEEALAENAEVIEEAKVVEPEPEPEPEPEKVE